jgi:hypothetical protein
MRILGIAMIHGLLHPWGIRSELLRVRTKDRSYSNSSSGYWWIAMATAQDLQPPLVVPSVISGGII